MNFANIVMCALLEMNSNELFDKILEAHDSKHDVLVLFDTDMCYVSVKAVPREEDYKDDECIVLHREEAETTDSINEEVSRRYWNDHWQETVNVWSSIGAHMLQEHEKELIKSLEHQFNAVLGLQTLMALRDEQ